MLERDAVLRTIQLAYAAREAGDTQAMVEFFAEDAYLEIAGDHLLQETLPGFDTPAAEALSALIKRFKFSDVELLNAVVEGNRVAARWQVTVTVVEKPPVSTQLFDLIQLDDQGKIISLIQFADTALVRYLCS